MNFHPQPIFYINAQLDPGRCEKPQEKARTLILSWLSEKLNVAIPKNGLKGGGFKTDKPTPVEVVTNGDFWAMRCQQPAIREGKPSNHIEAVLGMANTDYRLGVCLSCARQPNTDIADIRVPDFVKDLSFDVGLVDAGIPMNIGSNKIHEPGEVIQLAKNIFNANRQLPIIVVSEKSLGSQEGGMTVVPMPQLASRLHGLAHVVSLSAMGAWKLSDIASTEWSVFNGSVRHYRTGIDKTKPDEKRRHPLTMFEVIENFKDVGSAAFVHYLVREVYVQSLMALLDQKRVPSFGKIKEEILKKRIKDHSLPVSVHELLMNYEEERDNALALVGSLQNKVSDLQREMAFYLNKSERTNGSRRPGFDKRKFPKEGQATPDKALRPNRLESEDLKALAEKYLGGGLAP